MSIQTNPALRALGLFWKKQPKGESLTPHHGRSYYLLHKDHSPSNQIIFTGWEDDLYYFWFNLPTKLLKSKKSYPNHEEAMKGAEEYAIRNLDKIRLMV